MSVRAGWTYNGKHFTETHGDRGLPHYFIDGKPISRAQWLIELAAAMAADKKGIRRYFKSPPLPTLEDEIPQ